MVGRCAEESLSDSKPWSVTVPQFLFPPPSVIRAPCFSKISDEYEKLEMPRNSKLCRRFLRSVELACQLGNFNYHAKSKTLAGLQINWNIGCLSSIRFGVHRGIGWAFEHLK